MKNKEICTSLEQSQRILNLGINPNTADMYWQNNFFDGVNQELKFSPYDYGCWPPCMWTKIENLPSNTPSWSMSALLKILPNSIVINTHYRQFTFDLIYRKYIDNNIEYHEFRYGDLDDSINYCKRIYNENVIEAAVQMIEWIKENKYV